MRSVTPKNVLAYAPNDLAVRLDQLARAAVVTTEQMPAWRAFATEMLARRRNVRGLSRHA